MPDTPKNVAVLGATGSVGRNALRVIAASKGRLRAAAISGHRRLDDLEQLALEFQPSYVVATETERAEAHDWSRLPATAEVLHGAAALEHVVADPSIDVVLAALVGSAGLRSTWAALQAGKRVALANKETLVMSGPLVGDVLEQHGGELLPVDSEHSAIFQAMKSGARGEVERLVLTASGGPFRNWPADRMSDVTIDDALAHPTWNMGPKNTIDSATMMNKALEVIEARWLFDLPADKLAVMVHPQSVIHSMVEFVDGSVIAQMGPPDMKLPIQYALDYPTRTSGIVDRFDWTTAHQLELLPADPERFPALELGFECARAGGTSGAVLSAANEAAVDAFLEGDLHFTEIVPACRSVLESHHFEARPSLEQIAKLDAWARQEVSTWVCA